MMNVAEMENALQNSGLLASILNYHPLVATGLALVVLILAALFANFVVKALLLRILHRLLDFTTLGRDPELRRHVMIGLLANLMPALVISVVLSLVPSLPEFLVIVFCNISISFMILAFAITLSSCFNIIATIYHLCPEPRL